MLTATYSIVAISAEQKKARDVLQQLQTYILECEKTGQEADPRKLQLALDMLLEFEHYCAVRKVEKILIPAVKGSSSEVDSLVDELESLSARTMEMLCAVQEQLKQSIGQGVFRLGELCGLLARCCESLLKRFAREDEELLPMAMRLLSIDQWFDIAAKLLSEDSQRGRRRRGLPVIRAAAV